MLHTRGKDYSTRVTPKLRVISDHKKLKSNTASQQAKTQEYDVILPSIAIPAEQLIYQVPCGIVLLDCQGIIRDANPAAKALLEHNLVGMPWSECIQTVFAPRDDDGHEISLHNGKRVSISTQSLHPYRGQVIVLNDITPSRELQARLNREQRLVSLGGMLAQLVHQIRTPLASALLYASQDKKNAVDDDESRKQQKLVTSLRDIEKQLQDMLLYVKGGEACSCTCRVSELFKILEDKCLAAVAHYKGTLECHVDNDMDFDCQPQALVGALSNMIINALQVAEDTPHIICHAQCSEDTITISLRDNGPGMTPDLMDRIFEPFYTTRSQGTGLGLAIVKMVVDAHEGEITVQSEPHQGTCFTIQIPRRTDLR